MPRDEERLPDRLTKHVQDDVVPMEQRRWMNEMEAQLAALGTDASLLHAHLDMVANVLSRCDQQLWMEDTVITLDRMNIKRDAQDTSARWIALQEVTGPDRRRVALLLVRLNPAELPAA